MSVFVAVTDRLISNLSECACCKSSVGFYVDVSDIEIVFDETLYSSSPLSDDTVQLLRPPTAARAFDLSILSIKCYQFRTQYGSQSTSPLLKIYISSKIVREPEVRNLGMASIL